MDKTKKRGRKSLKKLLLLNAILIGIILFVVLLNVLLNSVSLNSNESAEYIGSKNTDAISCAEGKLIINNIEITVPNDENPVYNISYSWAEKDTDYPSIPRAAIASYYDQSDKLLYDISVYRESFTEKGNVPDGKDVSNWFYGWNSKNADAPGIKQGRLDSGQVHGFYISSVAGDSIDSEDTYAYYSYYFTAEDDEGISVYVLDGILYDHGSLDMFKAAISKSIAGIKIQKEEQVEDSEESPAPDDQD